MNTKKGIASTPIAVSEVDINAWGCPHCGYSEYDTVISPIRRVPCETHLCECNACKKTFYKLTGGAVISSLKLQWEREFPKLQAHPFDRKHIFTKEAQIECALID